MELEERESKAVDTAISGYRVAEVSSCSPVTRTSPATSPNYLERLSHTARPRCAARSVRSTAARSADRVVLDQLPRRPQAAHYRYAKRPTSSDLLELTALSTARISEGRLKACGKSLANTPTFRSRVSGWRLHAICRLPAYPRLTRPPLGAGREHGFQPVDYPWVPCAPLRMHNIRPMTEA